MTETRCYQLATQPSVGRSLGLLYGALTAVCGFAVAAADPTLEWARWAVAGLGLVCGYVLGARLSRLRVETSADGVASHGAVTTQRWRWDEIAAFKSARGLTYTHVFLVLHDGRTVELSSVQEGKLVTCGDGETYSVTALLNADRERAVGSGRPDGEWLPPRPS